MSTSTTIHDTAPTLPQGQTLSSVRAVCHRMISVLRRVEPFGQSAVLLALRLLYGWQFALTGWGKLAHLERTAGFFGNLGLPAPAVLAVLVGGTELAGGILLALGASTRLTSAALAAVLVTAYFTAHAAEGFQSLSAFTEQQPYPFLVATLILLAFGAGRLSVDGWLRSRAARPAAAAVGTSVERPGCQC